MEVIFTVQILVIAAFLGGFAVGKALSGPPTR